MISRTTTMALAKFYQDVTWGRERTNSNANPWRYQLRKDWLYDFLYKNEYEAWFLLLVKLVSGSNERGLLEFILRLHTGESINIPDLSWNERVKWGQHFLVGLSKDILAGYQDGEIIYHNDHRDKLYANLLASLELDGYQFKNNQLYHTEAAILDTNEETGLLHSIIQEEGLANQDVLFHHLNLSETDYLEGKWEDCIGNSRKFLEGVLQEVAAYYCKYSHGKELPENIYKKPVEVRKYLEENRILTSPECEALHKFYSLLSEIGGHPYKAEKDQARLLRHIALEFAHFVLLRFKIVREFTHPYEE